MRARSCPRSMCINWRATVERKSPDPFPLCLPTKGPSRPLEIELLETCVRVAATLCSLLLPEGFSDTKLPFFIALPPWNRAPKFGGCDPYTMSLFWFQGDQEQAMYR